MAARWNPFISLTAAALFLSAWAMGGPGREVLKVLLVLVAGIYWLRLALVWCRPVSTTTAASAWDQAGGWPDLMLVASEVRRQPDHPWSQLILHQAEMNSLGGRPLLNASHTRPALLAVTVLLSIIIGVIVGFPQGTSSPTEIPESALEGPSPSQRQEAYASLPEEENLPEELREHIKQLQSQLLQPETGLESLLAAISSAEAAARDAKNLRDSAIAEADGIAKALAEMGDNPSHLSGPDALSQSDPGLAEALQALAQSTNDPTLRSLLKEALGPASDARASREALARALERARERAGSPADQAAWEAAMAGLAAARDRLTANSLADINTADPSDAEEQNRPGSGAGREKPQGGPGSPSPLDHLPNQLATISGDILPEGDAGLVELFRSGQASLPAPADPESSPRGGNRTSRLSGVASDREDIPPSRLRVVKKYFEFLQEGREKMGRDASEDSQ